MVARTDAAMAEKLRAFRKSQEEKVLAKKLPSQV
jgi:hypothetical protein